MLQLVDLLGVVTGQGAGVFALLALVIGATLALLGLALVQAATACALVEIDDGRPIGSVDAYRIAFRRLRPLLRTVALFVVPWIVLTATAFLIPVALWLAVRWCLLAPGRRAGGRGRAGRALRRSGRLVSQSLDPRRLTRRGQRRRRARCRARCSGWR